ncbi:MAG: hypothetical protein LQ343_004079 [Gyalolechia ehrenbergii]|nr:MAG: hypothetical protein LQ343_004079 [Gyalolechia ehrenbergii]
MALQKDALVILGPRRHPPVPARAANTHTSIAIQTALGFSTLDSDDYVEAAQKLRPDIVFGMADYEHLKRPGVKRLEKMGDRSLAWTQAMVAGLKDNPDISVDTALFAPVLPIEADQQSYYLDALEEELINYVSGLVVYNAASVDAIPAKMSHLPRVAMTRMYGPHDLLDQIALGIDIFLPSFVGEVTDAGLALTFAFPSPESPSSGQLLVLGINMWPEMHAADLSPLLKDCTCYTCRKHHRAYIRHLLDAKEMLAWVLLQIHNHHVMDVFFDNVRKSMSNGTFEHSREVFEKSYERELPASTGQGPR